STFYSSFHCYSHLLYLPPFPTRRSSDLIPRASILNPKQVGGHSQLTLALGIIGATVMPHNLYLHSSISQTRKVDYDNHNSVKQDVRFMTWDSNIQLSLAFVVNSLLLVLGAALFYGHASDIG